MYGRLVLFGLLIAGCATAQYQDLATTDEGRVLYFSTVLRQKGTDQLLYQKLFAMDGIGLRLVASNDPGTPIGWTTANFYQMNSAEVTADGSLVAYTASRPCGGGSGCLNVERNHSFIGAMEMTGRVTISRNGRYALNYGFTTFGIPPNSFLLDLMTGTRATINFSTGTVLHRVVANDGTVLLPSGAGFELRSGSALKIVPTAEALLNTYSWAPYQISDDAARIVYVTASHKLVLHEVASGTDTVIATDVAEQRFSMTGDGLRVVYLRLVSGALQAFLAPEGRQIIAAPAGVTEATITGNGQIVYAVTGDGRLIRQSVFDGMTEIIPRTPWVTSWDSPTTAGSAIWLQGSALNGTVVRLNGEALPVLSSTDDTLWLQVPWDTPVSTAAVKVDPGDSPFETGPDSIDIAAFAPRFLYLSSFDVLAAHQDFSSVVTADNPARGGEVIHLWLTGLGAVNRADPLARITSPIRCQFWDGGPNNSEILFAGLAPGIPGFYQLDVRVPAGLRLSPVNLVCDSGNPEGYPSTFGSLAVQ